MAEQGHECQQKIKSVYTQLLQLQYQGCSFQLESTPIKAAHADARSEHGPYTIRRGAVLEYATLPEKFLSAQQRQRFAQHTPEPLRKLRLLDEQWREAEALVLAPHTFEVLRQLPELQQIISFTAVKVVQAAGAPGWHLNTADNTLHDLRPPSCATSAEVLQAMRTCPQMQQYTASLSGPMASLFDTLSPHMRLTLAAEVATGMLCPGQPAPRDTPEHTAALQLFLDEAYRQVRLECAERHNPATIQAAATPSTGQQCLQHPPTTISSSSRGTTTPSTAMPPMPATSSIRHWDLAPHIDLQLQVPPQQLLQRVLQLRAAVQQELQRQPAQPLMMQTLAEKHASGLQPTELEEAAVLKILVPHGFREALMRPLLQQQLLLLQQQQQQHSDASLMDQHTASSKQPPAAAACSEQSCTSSSQEELVAAAMAGFAQLIGSSPAVSGLVLQELVITAYHLVEHFLQDQLSSWGADSAQWQQAVPLQALQLVSAVRQLEAAGQAAVAARGPATATAAAAAAAADAAAASAAAATAAAASKETKGAALMSALAGRTGSSSISSPPADGSRSGTAAAAADRASRVSPQVVAAQQRIIHIMLSILQQVQHFKDCNAAQLPTTSSNSISSSCCRRNTSTNGSTNSTSNPHSTTSTSCNRDGGITDSNSTPNSSSNISSSNSSSLRMPPHAFFAGDGPLSELLGPQQPCLGLGFWVDNSWSSVATAAPARAAHRLAGAQSTTPSHTATTAAISTSSTTSLPLTCSSSNGPGTTATCPSSSSLVPHTPHAPAALAEAAWQALLAAGMGSVVNRSVDFSLLNIFEQLERDGEVASQAALGCRSNLAESYIFMCRHPSVQAQLQLVKQFLKGQGLVYDSDEAFFTCLGTHGRLAAAWHELRQELLLQEGASAAAAAWDENIQACGGLEGQRVTSRDQAFEQGLAASKPDAPTPAKPSKQCNSPEWDSWGVLSAAEQQPHPETSRSSSSGPCSSSGSCHSDSSSGSCHSDSSSGSVRRCDAASSSSSGSGNGRPYSTGSGRSGSFGTALPPLGVCDWLHQGQGMLRKLVVAATERLSPLEQCRQRHCLHRLEKQGLGRSHLQGSHTLGQPGAASGKAGQSAKTAAVLQQQDTTIISSSSTQHTKVWTAGPHDQHPMCNLCRLEAAQRKHSQFMASSACSNIGQHETSSSSSSPPITCQWPVPYDDPFLWRRLLWRLLGKLSPEAQAFYIRQGMCPHSAGSELWYALRASLQACLWTPAHGDLTELSLSSCFKRHNQRARCIRQYSRALNSAFVRGYHPSTVLLSKQVLLALSPLHHQVLPPAEVAHFLPSSFGPAMGKALMQALCKVPVLDGFEHQHCPLQLWHIWWHVGLRVYQQLQRDKQQEAVKQQQQQDQDGWLKKGANRTANSKQPVCDSRSSSSLPAGTSSNNSLDALYLDPDAKLFAVGYASRQLSGLHNEPPAALQAEQTLQRTLLGAARRHQLVELVVGAQGGAQTLHDVCQQQGKRHAEKPRVSKQQQLSFDSASAALQMASAFAKGQSELLAAVSGPRDFLIPPGQQRLQPNGDTAAANLTAVCHYLPHRPQPAVTSKHQGDQQGHCCPASQRPLRLQQQQQQEQAPQQQRKALGMDAAVMQLPGGNSRPSDVAVLALSSPCPVEALLDPEVWWSWQQALIKLDTCDTCGADTHQVVLCPGCNSAVYCSSRCMQQDEVHTDMCDKLRAAQQRYSSADASRPCGSSFPGLSVLLKPRELCELGRMASPCLAQPTFTQHGNSLVATDDFVAAAAEHIGQGWQPGGSRVLNLPRHFQNVLKKNAPAGG